MTIRAVAWDVDGTLIDSEPLHREARLAVCAEYGADLSDLRTDAFLGVGMPAVWRAIGPRFAGRITQAGWQAAIDAYYGAHADRLPADGTARALLEKIARMGIVQIVVSNSNRFIVDTNLDALGIGDLITHSISLDDVPAAKPDPAPYRMGAERSGTAPADMLAVEDSATGLASAHAAGMRTAFLTRDGAAPPQADHAIAGIDAVYDLLAADHAAVPAAG